MSNGHTIASSKLKRYLSGYALAILLTAIPFTLVATSHLSRAVTLTAIAITAVAQILVHLHFFLHPGFSPRKTWFVISIAFTAVILFIMVGGTLWILFELDRHMLF
jgi:cytochrome o ubiquinol oxidase operon protein cyoD